jgi:DNA polymerase elongation subunit (family B)
MSSTKTKCSFFPYQWSTEDIDCGDTYNTIIRIYGLNSEGESVYACVNDYSPHVYLELPNKYITWTQGNIKNVCDRIMSMTHKFPPVSYELQYKHKLYYSHLDTSCNNIKFPYLKILFPSEVAIKYFNACIRKGLYVAGMGNLAVKLHETKVSPILKFLRDKSLSTAGWIDFKGVKILDDYKESSFQHEYQCSWIDFKLTTNVDLKKTCSKPTIMSFDIEANSSNPNKMPDPNKPNDKIFQISCIICKQGDDEKDYKSYLLSLGKPNIIKGVTIFTFKSELALLNGFARFVQDFNPNVIVGYNILGWDYQYMIDRAELLRSNDFSDQGVLIGKRCEVKKISWSSSAYSVQEFSYIDPEGRLIVDMLPIIRRDHKLESYTLDSVSRKFKLAKFKQDLGHIGIFRCYKEFTGESLAEVGEYCVVDSLVCLLLFEMLNTWVGLTEMANICKVPVFYLYTKGQQIKCFSQLYIEALTTNTVVEQNVFEVDENVKFVGATVLQPREGLYDNVLMFDFASLYPSIIIAYNICYSTFAEDDKIPDSMCHILEWEDHVGCEHDKEVRKTKIVKNKIICGKHRYRYVKHPKGLVPTLVEKLLDARKEVRIQLKKAYSDNNKMLVSILDNRQLAIKVSANSVYGMMGVKKGFLPFTPGAASVTAAGRKALLKTVKYIEEEEKGSVLYGDTDSVFARWEHLKTPQECWDFSLKLEERFVGLFPKPMKLEFEEKFYKKLFMLSKKRYMAMVGVLKEGEVILDDALLVKGVVLNRRDNCYMLRTLYKDVVDMIFDGSHQNKITNHIIDNVRNVITSDCDIKEFTISKSVKDDDSYIVKPAHAVLATKMRNRGLRVDAGSRVPYVITTQGGLRAKQTLKIEDPEYFKQHSCVLKIDKLFYVSKLESPIDELLNVAFGIKDFMKMFIKWQIHKQKVHTQLLSLSNPIFIDTNTFLPI